MTTPSHPMQPLVTDHKGVVRFKANEIVRYILDNGGIDLNALALRPFSNEDQMQFAQLIGYSVSGYGELPYSSQDSVAAADRAAERLQLNGYGDIESEIERLKAEIERLRGHLRVISEAAYEAIGDDL